VDRGASTVLMLLLRMTSGILAPNSGLKMLREHQHRSTGGEVVDRFVESIRERMTYDASDLDPDIIEQGINSIRREWGVLQNTAKTHHREHQKNLHWILWNEHSRGPNDTSFFSSPFRTADQSGFQDLRASLSSLRDITEEVLMHEQRQESQWRTSLPETHLFGHAAPGSIWEKDGLSWMTSGVPMWELQNGGFNPKQTGGLVIEEPMLNELYDRTIRLLELPRATDEMLRAPQEERPLSVRHHR